ncbi:hypothetical protein BaRGS_00036911, partial [Batillaria attramentaria]
MSLFRFRRWVSARLQAGQIEWRLIDADHAITRRPCNTVGATWRRAVSRYMPPDTNPATPKLSFEVGLGAAAE